MSLLLLMLACGPKVPAPGVEAGDLAAGHLVLAHTNDLHAHYQPEPAEWTPDGEALGGFIAIESWVRALERQNGADAVLYLDAGDMLTGTPLMEMEARGVLGGGMLDLAEASGMDAFALGNHEFDRGFDHISRFVAQSGIPALTANLRAPCEGEALDCPPAVAGSAPWHIFEVNGLRVGVFGLTTSALGQLTMPGEGGPITIVDHASAARRAVAELEPQVDLVVALTHIGLEEDIALAEQVPGIDLIVGGHSHTRMEAVLPVGDSLIVQAGCYGRILGIAELEVSDGRIQQLDWRPQELHLDSLPMPPRPEMRELVEELQDRVDARFAPVVGEAPVLLSRLGRGETPLGRWASDVVRLAAQADVGVYNSGGLRGELQPGPVTVEDLYTVFPFGNRVVWFDYTGAELLRMLLSNASAELEDNRGALQISGVHYTWRERLGAPEIVQATVGGQPIDMNRSYKVATIDFVAAQWPRNLGADPGPVQETGGTMLDAAVEAARKGPLVDPGDRRSQRQ